MADFKHIKVIFTLEEESSCTVCLIKTKKQFTALNPSYRSVIRFKEWILWFKWESNQADGKSVDFDSDEKYEAEIYHLNFKLSMNSDFTHSSFKYNLIPPQLDMLILQE